MSRQFGIIVLAVGFAMGFATAALLFRQGADDSRLQRKDNAAIAHNHIQGPGPDYASSPQALSADHSSEHPVASFSKTKGAENVQASNQASDKEAIRYIWGDLIEELGLDTEKAKQLEQIFYDPNIKDPQAKLREELGEGGYQAYLNYLPTLPLRQEIVPFKAELAHRNIPLDRETEKMLLQIIREEQPSAQPGKVNDNRSQSQIRERIYHRAAGIFSGESLSLFKTWGERRL